ncbi:single-stranded DNA-binding protein [Slackia equolifaciens]
MKEALSKIDNLPAGKKFEVKDLFEGTKWSSLTRGEKVGFGIYFSNETREGRVASIKRLPRGRDNHSRYEKC